jgi:hypothetical protein
MTGIVRQKDGQWYVTRATSQMSKPVLDTVSWAVIDSRHTGPSAPELIDGLEVTWAGYGTDRWQAYRYGCYLVLSAAHTGTIESCNFPCPKVRANIETRYRDGVWQKYLKTKGWVAA